MRQLPVPQEIYRHFKGGIYQIITVAQHSETGEAMVVYQALYGSFETYVRPLSMFLEKTDRKKYPGASQEYRFERIGREEIEKKETGNGEDAALGIRPEKNATETNEKAKPGVGAEDRRIPEEAGGEALSGNLEMQPEEEIAHIDPMVMEFLDASSHEERLNILSGLHHKITDDMINIMSTAMDIEVKPGDIEERYAEFRSCLALMERFECNRLR